MPTESSQVDDIHSFYEVGSKEGKKVHYLTLISPKMPTKGAKMPTEREGKITLVNIFNIENANRKSVDIFHLASAKIIHFLRQFLFSIFDSYLINF